MTTNDDPAELFRAAIEEAVRGLSDTEFAALVARTRPPDYTKQFDDPADKIRALSASIAQKSSQRTRVDNNGRPLRENTQPPDEAALAAIDAEIKAALDSGDHMRVIALKQAKYRR
jgi:hypothetical protein